jgi:uncharacterized protein
VSLTKTIVVRVLKFDGTEYRRWNARLASRQGSLLVLEAEFDVEVIHELLGTIPAGTRTIEYYWLDRWYNVFRFLKDDDRTSLFYCNINVPPRFEDDVLTYVDLDIDILVNPDLSYQVLDLDDFERNVSLFGYPDETCRRAKLAMNELVSMIAARDFPFAA